MSICTHYVHKSIIFSILDYKLSMNGKEINEAYADSVQELYKLNKVELVEKITTIMSENELLKEQLNQKP